MKFFYIVAGRLGCIRTSATTRPVQTFETSAGPVKITPVPRQRVVEGGGKMITSILPSRPISGLPPPT
jgi:hypothetical protein